MITTRWWHIRHAPVTSRRGWCYGQEDHPADCSEEEIFTNVARRLPKDAVWVCSNLRRTRETAEAIGRAGYPLPELIEIPDLAEQHFGEWQGTQHDELKSRADSVYTRFWLAPARHCPPGGESFVDLLDRVGRAIDRLNREHAGRDIVAVTHGGVIRAAVGIAIGCDPESMLAFQVENVSLTRLDHIPEPTPAWRVNWVNQLPKG
jgi:broad specificity phosphatase PhoE